MWITNGPMIRMMQTQANGDPKEMSKNMLKEMGTYTPEELENYSQEVANNPVLAERLPKMLEAMSGCTIYPQSWDAFLWDLKHFADPIDFSKIEVPTLICHGDKDADIGYECAEAAAAIKGSELHK